MASYPRPNTAEGEDPYYRDALINRMKGNTGVSGFGPNGSPVPTPQGAPQAQPSPAPAPAIARGPGGTSLDVSRDAVLRGLPDHGPWGAMRGLVDRATAPAQPPAGDKIPAMPTPAPQDAAPAPVASPAPSGLGQFANRLEGFNSDKLNNPTHNSPKYQIARALSQFDPRQGVTPEVLAALNKLNIGQFSGSKDKVSIANGDPRFEGVNALDLVRGFNDPNGTGGWQYGMEGPPDAAGGAGAAMGGGMPSIGAIGSLKDLQGGDIMQRIQAALSQFMGSNG